MAAPSTATIALSGEAGETSISVTANGADATSGVASYTFQYSTTSEKEGFTTALEVQNTANSCTFEYQDLASDTTYYLRVIVKDRAGKTTTSIAVPATTKKAGLSDIELASNVGKYVDYTPVSGSFTSEGQYNGGSDQNFSTVAGLKWRILEADNNTLTLISDTFANTNFYLSEENGYNNAVLLLNNACKTMYSNGDWATGRSLNIDDIEKYSTYPRTISESTGMGWSKYYPNIYAREINGAPNGIYGTEFDLSEQDEYFTGYSSGNSSFRGKGTYYQFDMSTSTMKNQVYVDLFSNSSSAWLASRCASLNGNPMSFYIFAVSSNNVYGVELFVSYGHGNGYDIHIRPVVEIDLTKASVGATGDGSSNNPYSITAK